MKRLKDFAFALVLFLAVFAVFIGGWVVTFVLANRFGFNSQVTPQYGFTSGVGPMVLTALGMSTIVSGMWHAHNCHEPGCLRIGRHKINGTPWCNSHHYTARSGDETVELLREIRDLLRGERVR